MSSDAIPRQPFDARPLQLLAAIALAAGLLVSSFPTWATLTLSGLAMGLIIFVIASGLTLVFGLMDVLNFGHGVFVALGGFIAQMFVPVAFLQIRQRRKRGAEPDELVLRRARHFQSEPMHRMGLGGG